MKQKNHPLFKEYTRYKNLCELDRKQFMCFQKWLISHRPQDKSLDRWRGSSGAPSLWDKLDKDILYDAQLKTRFPKDEFGYVMEEGSMSKRMYVRKKYEKHE
jgi:hypothetical protein